MSPRGPIDHVASLQQDPQQCVNMWHTDRRERDVWQLKHCDERWDWRLECRWPALPPGAMVRFQPELTPRFMSGSVTTQWLGSVLLSRLIFPPQNMGTSLVGAASVNQMDILG